MSSPLTDADLAEHFARARGTGTDRDGRELAERVRSWLADVSLSHRDEYAVALEVLRADRDRAKAEDSSRELPAAVLADRMEGIGDGHVADLDFAAMDMAAWAQHRQQLLRSNSDGGIWGPGGR
jgi:hypothetical protein